PVIVYTVFTTGETTAVEVSAPVFQLYESAPETASVTVEPLHTVALFTARVGIATISIVRVAVAEEVPLTAIREKVFMPGVEKLTKGALEVLAAGVPPWK